MVRTLGGAEPNRALSARKGQPPPDLAGARTVEKGYGFLEQRRSPDIRTRTISISRECAAHLGWPGAAQVCRIKRIREAKGKSSREVAYAVTSLLPQQAGPSALLALWRNHRLIENRLHWRRNVILREDHSQVRAGAIPHAMAALRNTLPHITRNTPGPLAAAREALAENQMAAIRAAQTGLL